jgi:transmembrane sensor
MSLHTRSPNEPPVSEEIAATAASWVAKCHDGCGSPETEEALKDWLEASEDHRRAFRRMEHAWERAGAIRMRARREGAAMPRDVPATAGEAAATPRRRFRRRFVVPAAAAAVAAIVLLVHGWRDDGTATRVGQQRTQVLPDGTRVLLNTDTRIEVSYDERARRVRLVHGEAWFDVSHRPTWPFLVSVDGEEIRALGTSFIVRHDEAHEFSVTLVEGRISVAPVAAHEGIPSQTQTPQVMTAGQRLTLSDRHAPAIDRPELARITAWRRGQVDFDDTPLRDAANEMNRYSSTHVVVADTDAARLRVGGVFHAGDSDEFVRVVTAAFGLRADRRGDDIVLSPLGVPPH